MSPAPTVGEAPAGASKDEGRRPRTAGARGENVRRRFPAWKRPRTWSDPLVAALLTVLVQADLWYWLGHWGLSDPGPNIVIKLLQTVPVAFARRAPLSVLLVVTSAVVSAPLGGLVVGFNFGIVSLLVSIYLAASYTSGARSLVPALVALAGPLVYRLPLDTRFELVSFPFDLLPWTLFAGAWLLGRLARSRSARALAARRAAEAERRDITSEIHDSVGHTVTLIAMHAGGARLNFESNPEQARDALVFIERKARLALDEIGFLLGIRRSEEGSDPPPRPSLERLEDLVEQVRQAGLRVDLTVEGQVADLSPRVSRSAYRIVQDALTNALKYGGPRAVIAIRCAGDELTVDVRNDLRSPNANGVPCHHAGHGLEGMRERVTLLGGDLEVGPRAQEFVVTARLPLDRGWA